MILHRNENFVIQDRVKDNQLEIKYNSAGSKLQISSATVSFLDLFDWTRIQDTDQFVKNL